MLLRSSVGIVLVLIVLLYGYTDGAGLDGPCGIGQPFARQFNAQSRTIRNDHTVIPLAGECRAYARDGRLLGSMTYPESQYWLYALIAFFTPFAVGEVYRRWKRQSPTEAAD